MYIYFTYHLIVHLTLHIFLLNLFPLFSYICFIISLYSCAIIFMSILVFLAFVGFFFEVVLSLIHEYIATYDI